MLDPVTLWTIFVAGVSTGTNVMQVPVGPEMGTQYYLLAHHKRLSQRQTELSKRLMVLTFEQGRGANYDNSPWLTPSPQPTILGSVYGITTVLIGRDFYSTWKCPTKKTYKNIIYHKRLSVVEKQGNMQRKDN